MVNNWLNNAQSICFPSHCVLCGSAGEAKLDLCNGCQSDLMGITNPCYQCGLPLTENEKMRCGECLKAPPCFDHVVCGYIYQPPFSSLVQGLKFNGRLQYARLISQLMARQIEQCSEPSPELLIPVPQHVARTRERGFNQALELARILSKQFTINIDFRSCQRVRLTRAQSSLGAARRHANVKQAFSLAKPLTAHHVAIVDDVMTTGNTVNALARILKKSGVKVVNVWVAARTL